MSNMNDEEYYLQIKQVVDEWMDALMVQMEREDREENFNSVKGSEKCE